MKRVLIGVALAASTCALNAQNWTDTGNPLVDPGTNFLGSINAAALDMRTENIRRFTLLPDAIYAIGGFPAQVKNGSLLLSPNVDAFYAAGAPGPFSRLHLHDGTTSVLSAPYRPWMQNGITFTTNSDQMYIGHKVETGTDQTSAVIQWGDNDGPPVGPDVLKFR
jgi:hypothetical protein